MDECVSSFVLSYNIWFTYIVPLTLFKGTSHEPVSFFHGMIV